MVESGNGARLVTFNAGRPTVLDNCRADCACSRCGQEVVSTIISHYFSLSISTEILSQRAVESKTTTHEFNLGFSLTELKLPV